MEAHLAQPSGLAVSPDGATVYFADAEASAVRALDLASGRVGTLVGTGLFDFGHGNGPFAEALLQHPLGVAVAEGGRLLVADSYNGAVRALDLADGTVSDLDDGFLCEDPLCFPLSEPGGAEPDGAGRVLVADTNNHRIVELRPDTRRTRTWAA
jgi:sugar lactone lactonase YvrE